MWFDVYSRPFQAGGWVMWPLALASILGWYVLLRIAFRLMGYQHRLQPFVWSFRWGRNPKHAAGGSHKGSQNGSARKGEILRDLEQWKPEERVAIKQKLHELQKTWSPEFEKGFAFLSSVITVSPLLGLFGTVSGIINTFKLMGIFGTDNPALLGTGIREALVTTQAGLMVAVPLMIGHIFLIGKADRLDKLIEQQGWQHMHAGAGEMQRT